MHGIVRPRWLALSRIASTIVRAMHRLLKPADYVRMPWKDGGGQTTQIAVHPSDSTLSTFDWRVSFADVAVDGPFSQFAGVDRILVLLSGAGMLLSGDAHAVELRAPFEPYAFSGDDEISCALVDGPVRDFNLMMRRGRVAVASSSFARRRAYRSRALARLSRDRWADRMPHPRSPSRCRCAR
jgi:environmental stress-induced protein Ves